MVKEESEGNEDSSYKATSEEQETSEDEESDEGDGAGEEDSGNEEGKVGGADKGTEDKDLVCFNDQNYISFLIEMEMMKMRARKENVTKLIWYVSINKFIQY